MRHQISHTPLFPLHFFHFLPFFSSSTRLPVSFPSHSPVRNTSFPSSLTIYFLPSFTISTRHTKVTNHQPYPNLPLPPLLPSLLPFFLHPSLILPFYPFPLPLLHSLHQSVYPSALPFPSPSLASPPTSILIPSRSVIYYTKPVTPTSIPTTASLTPASPRFLASSQHHLGQSECLAKTKMAHALSYNSVEASRRL